jgi:hypothetical protein
LQFLSQALDPSLLGDGLQVSGRARIDTIVPLVPNEKASRALREISRLVADTVKGRDEYARVPPFPKPLLAGLVALIDTVLGSIDPEACVYLDRNTVDAAYAGVPVCN